MLSMTDGYRTAIVGDLRKMMIRAQLEIIDPDIVHGTVEGTPTAPWSKAAQLRNKEMELGPRYATLEPGRWLLDGSFRVMPDNPAQLTGEVGCVGAALSGPDGTFSAPQWVQMNFSKVDILQALAIYFSTDPVDGVPADFTVEVRAGEQVFYTKSFTGNTATSVSLDGFTVQIPTSIRLTVTRWSLPGRRMRIAEIVPGLYEAWSDDVLASLDIQMRGNFSCLALPYGTCTLQMDNLDRRFEPRRKNGIFQSIEDRQAIPVEIGVALPDGTTEWKQVGVFYQANGGWKTGNNAMTMEWALVDIVGLLADREFLAPSSLPTTLSGWLAALVGQLGVNFAGRYHVDPAYAGKAARVNAREDVAGKSCGDILRWVCMATGTWPRADAETGYLTAEPLWSQGAKMDLDNMNTYPTMMANEELAVLTFQLHDGAKTVLNISGNATASSKTLTVSNPFIHTADEARTAARQILSQYGGIKLETTGRGNPASEIGDVDTIWLDESSATTGRRMEQSLTFSGGVLRDCKSVLLQADGSYLYEAFAVIRQDGPWQGPEGVTRLRVVIGSGGQGGGRGQDGFVGGSGNIPGSGVSSGEGKPGVDGQGGRIWYGVIDINPGQIFQVKLGAGGAPGGVYGSAGSLGADTTFGPYSSANGKYYETGYTDIANGQVFARTGVPAPLPGTADGGKGGAGGTAGSGYWEQLFWPDGRPRGWDFIVDEEPGPGQPGVPGASGFVMVTWDKPA